VVISDADPSGPSISLLDGIKKDRITVSTVAINPHSGTDVQKMDELARRCGGRFYNVQDANKLPQIFIKEAATIQRSMIIEGTIPPVVTGQADALKGIGSGEIPALHGYTLTNPKPLSRTSMAMPIPKDDGDKSPGALDALLV